MRVQIDEIELGWDPERRVASGPRGETVLSAREARVLELLLGAQGAPVERQRLADELGVGSERAVDFAICRLRRKLERDPGEPRILQTVHGRGYRLPRPGAEPAALPPQKLLVLGDRQIDLDFGVVHLLGDELPLSAAQRLLLGLLYEAGEVARADLARALRRSCRTGAVERVVSELRALIEPVPHEPVFLLDTELGYRLLLQRARHNLGPLRPLIGRDREQKELHGLLQEAGWLELTGPVGVGKTLLARHLCLALSEELSGGAWAVDCTSLRTVSEVVQAASQALGSEGSSGLGGLWATLRRQGPVLLLLDGVDGVEGVQELALSLAKRSLELRLVTTSTRTLSAVGHSYRLAGLSPAEGRALYVSLAQQLGVEPGPSVDALVASFDGLPLAIELAARCAATLPSARLIGGDVLGALEAFGSGDALLGALEGAWWAAGAPLRRALIELSCLQGSFDLQDAVSIAEVSADTLQELVNCSLVVEEAGRYRVLGVLRQFLPRVGRPARETLERYQRRMVEQARVWGQDPPHRAAVDRASADLLEVATQLPPAQAAVVAHALACCQHRPTPQLRGLVEGLLQDAGSPELWLDTFQWRRLEGDLVGAEQALAAALAAGQDPDSWHARYARIIVAVDRGGLERVELGEEPAGPMPRARWWMVRGRQLVQIGETVRGYGLLVRAHALCHEHGFTVAALSAERHLAEAMALLGAPPELVARRLERTLLGLEAMGCWSSATPCALQAAVHRTTAGHASQARALVQRARQVAHDLDLPREESRARALLLRIGLADDDPRQIIEQALDVAAFARSLEHGYGVALARYAEAVGRAAAGDRQGALELATERPAGFDRLTGVGLSALAALLDPSCPLPEAPTTRHWARSAVLLAAHLREGQPLRDRYAKRDAAHNPMIRALTRVSRA